MIKVTCQIIQCERKLSDGWLPAETIGHAPALHVTGQLVEELERRHPPLDDDVIEPLTNLDHVGPRGSLPGLSLGRGQGAPEQQALDVEQMLGKIPEVEGDKLGLELDPPTPERGEAEAGGVWPWGSRVTLHHVSEHGVPALHAGVSQHRHLDTTQVTLEQRGAGLHLAELLGALHINIRIPFAQIGQQLINFLLGKH